MIRKPLRPLAKIFFARSSGQNPDLIEQVNHQERTKIQLERVLRKTQRRLIMVSGIFVISFGVIGMRMTALATSEVAEPKAQSNKIDIAGSPVSYTHLTLPTIYSV